MHIFFDVNVAAAMRLGNDFANRHATLQVDPAQLSPEDRILIADRLDKEGYVRSRFPNDTLALNPHIEAVAPTLDGLLSAIRAEEQIVATARAEKEREREQRYTEVISEINRVTSEVISEINRVTSERLTTQSHGQVYDGEKLLTYNIQLPAWPYGAFSLFDSLFDNAKDEIIKQLRATRSSEWVAELESLNAVARAEAERLAAETIAQCKRDAAAAAQERADWIAAHGSSRLQRVAAEGFEYAAIYRNERLAHDRPGWRWWTDVLGDEHDPRNPTDQALELLDKARTVDPKAKLVYVTVDADDDHPPLNGSKYHWTGYGALADFLGYEIVLGDDIPDDKL